MNAVLTKKVVGWMEGRETTKDLFCFLFFFQWARGESCVDVNVELLG